MVNPLFENIGRFLSAGEQVTSDSVRASLCRAGYPDSSQTLSRMSVNVLMNLPGVDCVLNGMRRIEYVEDAMEVPNLPSVNGLDILRKLHSQKGEVDG